VSHSIQPVIRVNPEIKLPPFDPKSGRLNAIIETPRGCRNKYSYDEERQIFKLGGVLPSGRSFPSILDSYREPRAVMATLLTFWF
jgi:hypothetical protein